MEHIGRIAARVIARIGRPADTDAGRRDGVEIAAPLPDVHLTVFETGGLGLSAPGKEREAANDNEIFQRRAHLGGRQMKDDGAYHEPGAARSGKPGPFFFAAGSASDEPPKAENDAQHPYRHRGSPSPRRPGAWACARVASGRLF